ncbi:MAG: sulfate reduction electron transfer complex DsrMKJOP subunit DsrM [Actinobacteria bacterium]|nr:sulfate reduction electron transfer complex DsrMKJOP subunit DsrM [Actinomycetota bacterium]
MKMLLPLLVVLALALVAFLGGEVGGLRFLFGVVFPYLAFALFVVGFVYRVVRWARSPVPYHIPTTCGQQKSLPWIQASNLESPYNTLGVVGRLAMEVLLFRSLFRNTSLEIRGKRLLYRDHKILWLAAIAFHWSMLVVIIRHSRFFTEPVPVFVTVVQSLDGFFQIGEPVVYITTVTFLLGLAYLLFRRITIAQVQFMSLTTDYFALFLLLGIGLSGALMRYFFRTDVEGVKELAMGLVALHPVVPDTVSPLFFVHLFLVSSLLAYFPASKLMHMGGILLSPTRNLANNSRMRRHVNPWNYPVPLHTYAEWQEEFKDKLEAAGIPLDPEPAE